MSEVRSLHIVSLSRGGSIRLSADYVEISGRGGRLRSKVNAFDERVEPESGNYRIDVRADRRRPAFHVI